MRSSRGNQNGSREHRPILITGGCGFVGANLAAYFLRQGRAVLVLDNLCRAGVRRNLAWLKENFPDLLKVTIAGICDRQALEECCAQAGAVFHLAAQVAVTSSTTDPVEDYRTNLQGTVDLLETLRGQGAKVPLVFVSTNKVYGDLEEIPLLSAGNRFVPQTPEFARGISEQARLHFNSPYACSKGAADQYVLTYANTYNLPFVVLRLSCIYGPLQHGNADQGWVCHFMRESIAGRPITIFGSGRQVRDLLHVDDLVRAFVLTLQQIGRLQGRAYNLGGGSANAVSLLEVCEWIEQMEGSKIALRWEPDRPGDQRYYVSDFSLFQKLTTWSPNIQYQAGMRRLYEWVKEQEPALYSNAA